MLQIREQWGRGISRRKAVLYPSSEKTKYNKHDEVEEPGNLAFRIIYDITGLVTRQSAETPVGLDRVNLRYAEYLSSRYPNRILFVKQKGQQAVLVNHADARALIDYLDSSWSPDKNNSHYKDSLSFRIEHARMTDPDYDSFFGLPFSERFNYLLHRDLKNELGPEFAWVSRFPFIFKIAYAFIGAASRWPARTLVRLARFIGIYSRLHNWKAASRIAFRKRVPEVTLRAFIEKRKHKVPGLKYYYVNSSQFVGVSLDLLDQLRETVDMDLIFLIHDLLPVHYPEYFINEFDALLERRALRILKLHPHIITNSKATKEHVEMFAAKKKAETRPIVSMPLGVEEHFLHRPDLPESTETPPYFMTLCTIEPRKNHLLLLHIWRELARGGLKEIPRLYLVGRRGWENENVVDMLERSLPLRGAVLETSDVQDEELLPMLAGARALLFPTFAEGWGMPVVEALSLGTPVICSDIPALRESGQGVPDYINPLDGRRWMDTIVDYCRNDSPLRRAQLERIKSYRPPSWEDHFAGTLDRLLPPVKVEQEMQRKTG